jgi:integrase
MTLPLVGNGEARVTRQRYRDGTLAPPKSEKGNRAVPIPPGVVRIMRTHKERAFADGQASPDDCVFTREGRPLSYDRAYGDFRKALKRAGIAAPRPRFHDLRHTAISILIAGGLDPAYVAKVAGHASIKTTLDVYAHLWSKHRHEQDAVAAMEDALGKSWENGGRERRRTEVADEPAKVAVLRDSASGG